LYERIVAGKERALFLVSKSVETELPGSFATHDALLKEGKMHAEERDPNLLDLKILLARDIFKKCTFCERRCAVNREEQPGYCQVTTPLISCAFPHYGEERILVPSGTIFFSGCNARCIFCQNWDISQHLSGDYWSAAKTVEWITRNKKAGTIINVNFVGGEPTPNLLYVLTVLRELDVNIPIIWNSNFYMSEETMSLLDGVIDLYLSDFKYGTDERALQYSDLPNYWEIATRNHKIAYNQCEMIIRVLVLPGKWIEEDLPRILAFIEKELPEVRINLMSQYRPAWKAHEHPELSQMLTSEEWKRVCKIFGEYTVKPV
jgi:putative pyruvate formate lyase activating enzyme